MSLRKPSFDSSETGSEINISPLIDVMFILLIFFVVTMAFAEKSIIAIERPKSDQAEKSDEKTLNVFVEKSGRINVSGGFVSLEGLEAIAAARPEKTNGDPESPGLRFVARRTGRAGGEESLLVVISFFPSCPRP